MYWLHAHVSASWPLHSPRYANQAMGDGRRAAYAERRARFCAREKSEMNNNESIAANCSCMTRAAAFVFVILLASLSFAAHSGFDGPVVRVKDGDSLIVSVGHKEIDVRLDSIDAPE